MPGRLLVLDTPSLYFRAFHGVPQSVVGADGSPANAVRGLLDMLARLLRDRRPDRVVAAMDGDWRPAFRVAALPSYKAHRVGPSGGEVVPDALVAQLPAIGAVLDALGVTRLEVAGYEADDVIGTVATRAVAAGDPVEIVTGDRDLFQLVRDDPPVRVIYLGAGIARPVVVDEAEIARRYDIPGRAYADYALLRGDPSDGLPGVPGVGEKTAAELIRRFGSLAGLRAALAAGEHPALPARLRARLLGAADYLAAAPTVVGLVTDLALPAYDDRLPTVPRDPQALVALADRWGLDGPLRRFLDCLAAAHAGGPADSGSPVSR